MAFVGSGLFSVGSGLFWAKVNPSKPHTVENSMGRGDNSQFLGLLLVKIAEKVNPSSPQTVENSMGRGDNSQIIGLLQLKNF